MSLSILERQNNFLYFDEEDIEVKVTPQAMDIPEVKILFRRDKTGGKKFFQKTITFLYYAEHKDSPHSHKIESVKVKDLKRMYDDLREFDHTDERYLELKKVFKASHYSMKELRYMKAMEDIEAIITMSMDVPIQISKKVELTRTIDCFDESGNSQEREIKFKETIMIDNSTEKANAIKNIKSMNELVELLEQKIKLEYKKDQINATRSIFDE